MFQSAQPKSHRNPLHVIQKDQKRLHLHDVPGRQNIDFSIGLPIPITIHHPDFLPLSFGIAVLAKWGGFAGRLMSTVREKEGLTYGIYGRLESFHGDEQGFFRIMTFFAPDKAVHALTSTFREISKLYTSGITQKEFNAFQTILLTQQQLLNDSLGRLLGDLHSYHCHGFTIHEMHMHKAQLQHITRTEVNRAIKTYLNPKEMYVSGAGPVAGVQKDLEQWMKSMS
jgi:zinc protease